MTSPVSPKVQTGVEEVLVTPKVKAFNVDRLNDKALLTMKTLYDLQNYIINENQAKTNPDFQYNLGVISIKLEIKINRVKSDSQGIFAFFKFLFRPSLRREEEQKVEYMQTLKTFVEGLRGKNVAMPKAIVSAVSEEESEEVPFEEGSLASPTGFPPEGETTASVETVPPPAPPLSKAGGPPPPPPISMFNAGPKSFLTPAQRQLAARANPLESFYIVQFPPNEAKLTQQKMMIEERINILNPLLPKLAEDDKAPIEKLIQNMKKEVENLAEELKGIAVPMKSNSIEFTNKLQNPKTGYPNEELKIILGIAFDGKKPNATHPQFKIYTQNQKLFDNIFDHWEQLSKGEKGTVYLPHTVNWKRYLGVNLFGFTSILRDRLSDKLPEPTNKTQPKATTKSSFPIGTKLAFTKGNATGDMMEELAQKLPPKFEG